MLDYPIRFFADNANLNTGYLPFFGGDWDYGSSAGAFQLYVIYSTSGSDAILGAR